MPIAAQCRCGKKLRVRDSAAGKRIKCPDCEKPVSVPEPVIEEYDDDLYDNDQDPYAAPPSRSRPPKRNTGKSKKRKAASKGGGMLPLLIVGAVVAGIVLAAGLAYMFLSSSPSNTTVAATDTPPEESGGNTTTPVVAANDGDSGHDASGHDAGDQPASGHDASPQNNSNNSGAMPVTSGGSQDTSDMWVVLSNFKEQNSNGIGKTLNVSYRVTSGQPKAGQQYVLFVGSSMGMMTRFQEVDLDLNNRNGTVTVPVSSTMNSLTAYVALKIGRRDWKPVSGEIKIGGAVTAATRPPTVQESAGAAAQGKMFALANGRFEDGRIGGKAIVVDYVMQRQYTPGFQYYLIIKGDGDPLGAMITTSLMRTTVGTKDELGIRQMGRPFPTGNLTAQIVKRRGMLARDEEVVSNTITIRR